MERNFKEIFTNNDSHKSVSGAVMAGSPETALSLELSSSVNSEVLEFIKKERFVADSLSLILSHDQKTFKHSLEMGNIAEYLVEKLGEKISLDEARDLMAATLLHDFGKIKIDRDLLNKEKITPKEKDTIKEHVKHSFELIRLMDESVAEIAVGHHEHQLDPYPRKTYMPVDYDLRTTKDRNMALTRILAMVDAYEAMVANRPGNPPKDFEYINSELEKQFRLPGDQEVIFLLMEYYCMKNPKYKIKEASCN